LPTKLQKVKKLIFKLIEEHGACYGRELEVRLEGENSIEHWDVHQGRKQLVREGKIRTIDCCGAIFFCNPSLSDEMLHKIIRKKCQLIERLREVAGEKYGEKSLGKHAETVVLRALEQAGFTIAAKDIKWFMGRTFPGEEDLDFLAVRDEIWYGIEVKNMLDNLKWRETGKKDIETILNICKTLGIVPMIITRYLPRPYRVRLIGEGALIITYGTLIIHPDFIDEAERWRQVFGYPVRATSEPWDELVQDIVNAHNYAKRKRIWQRWKK